MPRASQSAPDEQSGSNNCRQTRSLLRPPRTLLNFHLERSEEPVFASPMQNIEVPPNPFAQFAKGWGQHTLHNRLHPFRRRIINRAGSSDRVFHRASSLPVDLAGAFADIVSCILNIVGSIFESATDLTPGLLAGLRRVEQRNCRSGGNANRKYCPEFRCIHNSLLFL